jgi:hypothetical protein
VCREREEQAVAAECSGGRVHQSPARSFIHALSHVPPCIHSLAVTPSRTGAGKAASHATGSKVSSPASPGVGGSHQRHGRSQTFNGLGTADGGQRAAASAETPVSGGVHGVNSGAAVGGGGERVVEDGNAAQTALAAVALTTAGSGGAAGGRAGTEQWPNYPSNISPRGSEDRTTPGKSPTKPPSSMLDYTSGILSRHISMSIGDCSELTAEEIAATYGEQVHTIACTYSANTAHS